MPTSLTATKIKDTYGQLLHVDGGVNSTLKIVYDGDGTATALKVSSTAVEVPTLTLSGGTANGVAYLNGSNVLTSGSALTFDGTNLGMIAGLGCSIKNISAVTQANLRLGSTYVSGSNVNTDWSIINSFTAYGDLAFRSGTSEGDDPRVTGSTRLQMLRDGTSIWSVGGSEQMRLTSTGLGIGTSSPGAKLDVNGSTRSTGLVLTGSAILAGASQTTVDSLVGTASRILAWGPNASTAGKLYLGTISSDASVGSTSAVVLDGYGNLGLGVTPSAWSAAGVLQQKQNYTSSEYGYGNNGYYNGGWKYIANDYASLMQSHGGGFRWYTAPSGTAGNAISFTQAMTLDASGNLGIGISAPTQNGGGTSKVLHVNSAGASDWSTTHYTTASTGTTGGDGLVVGIIGGSDSYVFNYENTNLIFGTNANERMRIDASGNLITNVNGTAPTLTTNSTMSFELTDNTTLKIKVRGTDGTTRSVTLTLA